MKENHKSSIKRENKIRKMPILTTLLIGVILVSIAIVDAEKGIGQNAETNITNKSNISALAVESQIYSENFESGYNGWSVDNGIWEIGNSVIDPVGCYEGSGCAGTVLNGNYPLETDSALISPSIILPLVATGEEIHLRLWQWFFYNYYAYGYIAISVYNTTTITWENPQQVGGIISGGSGAVWSITDRDLTQFAGKKIKIYFQHVAATHIASGWTIDNVEITNTFDSYPRIFTRGTDNALWYRTLSTGWEYLGGIIKDDPDATTLNSKVYVFARGTDNALWYRRYDGSWNAWTSLGGIINSAPGSSSPWSGKIYVFARGTDNALWYRSFDGTSWTGWTSLGGIINSGPGAS